MPLFEVDPDKCNRDGICVDECPIKIIALKDKESVPQPVNGADQLCINCGHCVAVCPTGALSHQGMAPQDCPPVRKEWQLGPEQAEHFLRARRSIRTYKDKPVDRETLSRLIKIASCAPSAHNTQPVQWHVVHDTSVLHEQIGAVVDWMRYMIKEQPEMAGMMHLDMVVAAWEMGIDVVCRGAPHVIIAHGHKDNPMAPNACVIAMTYLELAAPALGLGSCWAGFYNTAAMYWPDMINALGLPEGHVSYGAAMIGYPKYKYHRMPLRNAPVVTWA